MRTLGQIAGYLEEYHNNNDSGVLSIYIHNGVVTHIVESKSHFPIKTEIDKTDNILIRE